MAINEALEDRKIASAFPELRCTFGDRSIVPDVSVFTWQRIPFDETGDVADIFNAHPDWMIEVLSPGQSPIKVTHKILHSLSHGTQMGWLIDPSERTILTYPRGKQPQSFEDNQSRLSVPEFAGSVNVTHGDVFGWLKL